MIDRYTRQEMRDLWSNKARFETWLKVELAVCQAMEEEGLVPAGIAAQVRQSIVLDPERMLQIEERVKHDVIAFLAHLEEQAGEPVRWLHLGMTSSDVLDTAFALQLRQAGQLIMADVDHLCHALHRRAHELKDMPMVGRTHGIHAEPTSVGLVFAGYYAEMGRHRDRLAAAIQSISAGKIAGAVGVYGNVSPQVEGAALESLGLYPEPCATQVVQRDRHAEYFSVLALIASSVERMALQVRHWQRTEVGEASEPFGRGQKGSSAMPHKRSPILCENICGLARLVRSYATAALENIPLWHERDISHSSVERVIAPDATCLVDFMLHRMTSVMEELTVYPDRIARNLQLSGGLIFSESVMLGLVRKGMARQKAYEVVQRNAMAAIDSEKDFAQLLAADAEVTARLTSEDLQSCFNLQHHLRHVDVIFARVFAGN